MGLTAFRKRILSMLAQKMDGYIPQFEPYSSDYQMVGYACRDFEEWMKKKWDIDTYRELYKRLEEKWEQYPEEFDAFLNFWAGLWLGKWAERVKVLFAKRKIPADVLERIKEAKRLYRQMNHRKELKGLLTRKLIGQGEICMTGFIAENLIVEEIAKVNQELSENKFQQIMPFTMFNTVSSRILQLPNEKGPLVYLNIKPRMV